MLARSRMPATREAVNAKKLQAWRDAGAIAAEKPKAFYRLEAVFDTLSRDR